MSHPKPRSAAHVPLRLASRPKSQDEESRRLEFEKMVETLRIGHARRLKEKADKKAERKLAKSAGLAVDDDSVCAESVCDDLDDWEGRGRGTACFTWGDHL